MAANPTPDDDAVLKALAEDLADGDHDHEVSIGIKQNTEAVLRAAITGTSANSNGVSTFSQSADANYNQPQIQALFDKVDELITAMRRP